MSRLRIKPQLTPKILFFNVSHLCIKPQSDISYVYIDTFFVWTSAHIQLNQSTIINKKYLHNIPEYSLWVCTELNKLRAK